MKLYLTEKAYQDLKNSAIDDEHIEGMRVEPFLEEPAYPDDYKIPQFDTKGILTGDYRVKLFRDQIITSDGVKKIAKYLQPENSPNALFIPHNYKETVWTNKRLWLTEGEKKASALASLGETAVAVTGINSWKTNVVTLDGTKIIKKVSGTEFNFKLSDMDLKKYSNKICKHMPELFTGTARHLEEVIICFDNDTLKDGSRGVKFEVMDEAFKIANYLTGLGIVKVTYCHLPAITESKTGIDDYLAYFGGSKETRQKALVELLKEKRVYPAPENIINYVHNSFDKKKLTRHQAVALSKAVIAHLDTTGTRIMDGNRRYYFDTSNNKLSNLNNDDDFSKLINTKTTVKSSDSIVFKCIKNDYPIGPSVLETKTSQAKTVIGGDFFIQLSDSKLLKINKDQISMHNNGDEGVVFEQGAVKPLDIDLFSKHIGVNKGKVQNPWLEILKQTTIKPMLPMDFDETYIFLSILFCLSPYLKGFKGLMLPFEILTGEANSGKTFIYNLRNRVLTGRSMVSKIPTDLKDWYADLSASPSIWVGDNATSLTQNVFKTMPSEIARLITSEEPAVAMRELFTTNSYISYHIECSLAITTINNPFRQEDILQRSVVYEMEAIEEGKRMGNWHTQLAGDGKREELLAKICCLIKNFLHIYDKYHNPAYLSKNRLQGFEESIMFMGKAMGYKYGPLQEIVSKLALHTRSQITANSAVIEAISVFKDIWLTTKTPSDMFKAKDIINIMSVQEGYYKLAMFKNSTALGKVLQQNKYDLEKSIGFVRGKKDHKTFTYTFLTDEEMSR